MKTKTRSRTRKLAAADKRFVWHPFTQMQEWSPQDMLVIESGKGPWLFDTDGNKYLDGVSSLWCNVHGHRVPAIDRALRTQLGRIAHSTFLGLSNPPAIELAQKLVGIAPQGLKKVFYSDSGSESVEIALKMAFQYWKQKGRPERTKFLKLHNSYHGDTLGSVSVGGIDLFHEIYKPLLFETVTAPAPNRYHEGFTGPDAEYAKICAGRIERVLKEHAGQIAAVIAEPLVQGAAGMILQPSGFLKRLAELARKYDTLLILDEVATGFGRTGRMFACEHEGVRPDLLCAAKGLTGGYLPLAVTLATDEVYNAFLGKYEEFKTFFHGHTYTANPLACAAALANLEVFRRERTIEKSAAQAFALEKSLAEISKLSAAGDIRQIGLMAGIELVADKRGRKGYPPEMKMGARVARRAREYGAIIRPLGNVVVLMPSFAFSVAQIRTLCAAVKRAIQDETQKP